LWAIASPLSPGPVYHQRVNDLTVFILAGGKSSRMGEDKAFLQLAGETLLSRALNLARSLTANVRIVGNRAKFAMFSSVVEDIYPECGPLGGIHAALVNTQTALNLMMAVDTPLIQWRFLDFLITEARRSGAVITVPRTGGYMHPLCAVYRREFATVAEKSLMIGQNKIDSLFTSVQTRVIEEEELSRLGLTAEMFHNLNAPQDWERAQLRFAREGEAQAIEEHSKDH
jgi:molybdopterin-guanine dinucleotide biosynthesis protein A